MRGKGPIRLTDERGIARGEQHRRPRTTLQSLPHHDIAALDDAPPLREHDERRRHERPCSRVGARPCRQRDAPHERPAIIGPQLVGIEHRLSDPPTRRFARERHARARPGGGKRPADVATPAGRTAGGAQAHGHGRRGSTRRACDRDGKGAIRDPRLGDAPVRQRLAARAGGEREDPHTTRDVRPALAQRGPLEITHDRHLPPRQGLGVHEPGRPRDRLCEIEPPPAGHDRVHRREQAVA